MRVGTLRRRMQNLSQRTGCNVYLKVFPDGRTTIAVATSKKTTKGHFSTAPLSAREWAGENDQDVAAVLELAEAAVDRIERSCTVPLVQLVLFP